MDVLDEEGRLFGVVNVIDALVVVFALAVLVAGVALVTGSDGGGGDGASAGTPTPPGQPTTQHATLDLGTHPAYVASLVQPGPATLGGANVTVTDVYRTPAEDGVHLITKVAVEGRATPDGFRVGEQVLRYGVGLRLATPAYQLDGRVATLGGGEELRTRTVSATVEANVSTAVAGTVSTGDTQTIANDTVATITAVRTVDSGDDWTVIRAELSLSVRPVGGAYLYSDQPLRIGTELDFATPRYAFGGEVVEVSVES